MTVKTPMGFLSTEMSGDVEHYPGVNIMVGKKGRGHDPLAMVVCTVEYDNALGQLQAVVYADGESDEPTHIIPIILDV